MLQDFFDLSTEDHKQLKEAIFAKKLGHPNSFNPEVGAPSGPLTKEMYTHLVAHKLNQSQGLQLGLMACTGCTKEEAFVLVESDTKMTLGLIDMLLFSRAKVHSALMRPSELVWY